MAKQSFSAFSLVHDNILHKEVSDATIMHVIIASSLEISDESIWFKKPREKLFDHEKTETIEIYTMHRGLRSN